MPTFKISDQAVGQRLDLWLTPKLGLPRSSVQRLIKAGRVTVGYGIQRSSYRLRAGDEVTVVLESVAEATHHQLDLPVLYQDDDVIVIDKPAGLTVHPARILYGL
jgi:23S rRNA-/tRNA-specific pseudouridylate synthase